MLSLIIRGLAVLDPGVRRRIPLMLAAVIALSALETIGISAIFPIILLLIDPSAFLSRPFVASIYAWSGLASPRDFAVALVTFMIGALVLKNVASILLYRWQFGVVQAAAARFSVQAFENYLRMPYLASLQRDTGFFSYAINALGTIICSTFVYQLVLIVSELITVSLLFCVLVYANAVAAGSAFVVLLTTGTIIYAATAVNLGRIGQENRNAAERTARLVNETFGSFKELRVLGRGGRFLARYAEEAERMGRNQATLSLYNTSTRYLVEIAMLAAIGAFVGVTIAGENLANSIGLISLFGASSLRILPSVSRILGAMQTMKTLESSIGLAEEEASHAASWSLEPVDAINAPVPVAERQATTVSLRQVSFQYQGTAEPAIRNVSLEIPFGESLGVVGASGSGKTTVADIILGVITPEHGKVLSNGEDIHADLIGWRRRVAYVPQQIAFVSGTIRSNIAFGLRDDEIDDARVVSSLETAQLSSLVGRLPLGINSPIGEAGKLLSGGERQRLGIARALYQNASVLVLDEATSALDVETEDRLTTLLHGLRGICSTIVIAHRLRTIRECDRVALFADGELVAIDTFDALSANERRFARLVELSNLGIAGISAENEVELRAEAAAVIR
jgi:ATP-binding cassette, subfamily B, bacterial PglK